MNYSNSNSLFLIGLFAVLCSHSHATEPKPTDSTLVERETKRPKRAERGQGLGTAGYSPSTKERPYFERLIAQERTTGTLTDNYNIATKDGRYVGWFGIVRDISEDEPTRRTTLTIEHKYFDGLTDSHIQAVSYNGSGDFRAVLRGVGHQIEPYTLVKVYGLASVGLAKDIPQIETLFVRNWHWGTFTFLAAYGTQRGSEKWRKLNQVELDDIYDLYPGYDYYTKRLGKRPDEEARRDIVRRRAIQAAVKIRPSSEKTVARLIDALFLNDNPTLDEAIVAGSKVDGDNATVAALVEAMKYDEDDVRERAAETLGSFGSVAVSALPVLIAALEDGNRFLRGYCAARALGELGSDAKQAVPALITTVKVDDDSSVRAHACEALGKIGAPAGDIVPILIEATNDEDHHVRWMAIGALGEIGAAAAPAAKALIERLRNDDDDDVRWQAAGVLAKIDSEGKLAVPVLVQAMRDRNDLVRRFAATAIGEIGSKASEAIPVLVQATKDQDPLVRIAAAKAIWRVDKNIKSALPTLVHALKGNSGMARMSAADAVAQIGADGKDAVTALRATLTYDHKYVRSSAARALGMIGLDSSDVIPALIELLDDESGYVRANAAEALWRISRHSRAIPALVKELTVADSMARYHAARAISEIGPPAKEAVPVLNSLLTDRDFRLRKQVAQALKRLNPDPSPTQERSNKN